MTVHSYSQKVIDRFHSKVSRSRGCWEWAGWRNDNGYGYFQPSSQKKVRAHRFMYELVKGEIPNGLVLDHLCRNRGCVNPAHLEPVSPAENTKRAAKS